MRPFLSINPFTEESLKEYPFTSIALAEQMLSKGNSAFEEWRKTSIAKRSEPILKLAVLLRTNANELAKLASIEMGKLQSHAKGEILKSATLCEYYATNAQQMLTPQFHQIDGNIDIEISFEPLGMVLGIFPWNFPYWQILRSAIPIIMSGNTILVKPAPNVPQCSLALQNLIDQCGLIAGVYQTIFANDEQVATLIADDRISATTLTGSEAAGSAVAAQSGKYIKPNVLELGGSDALIILNDALLDEVIEQAVFARFQNNGQSCVAAKRFLVQTEIAEIFTSKLINKLTQLILGDPTLEQTNLGPLARKDLLELLTSQVTESVAAGAHILFQSNHKPVKGYFYPPTILSDIPPIARAYQEELFGPVIGLYTFNTANEAIQLANDTRFGLGASIYSTNLQRAKEIASQIDSGMVYINQIVKSDVRFPFGGIKKSGYGRELGDFGLKTFCNIKSVWVNKN